MWQVLTHRHTQVWLGNSGLQMIHCSSSEPSLHLHWRTSSLVWCCAPTWILQYRHPRDKSIIILRKKIRHRFLQKLSCVVWILVLIQCISCYYMGGALPFVCGCWGFLAEVVFIWSLHTTILIATRVIKYYFEEFLFAKAKQPDNRVVLCLHAHTLPWTRENRPGFVIGRWTVNRAYNIPRATLLTRLTFQTDVFTVYKSRLNSLNTGGQKW